ncbi:MAG: tetratricopeptide repeat protein [Chloroflexi bacterium]|nr:tetratricopeptide repeat protein [Chloroflexota bacterium]
MNEQSGTGRKPLELPWDRFLLLRALLLEKTGMYFDDNKFGVVRNVVSERINATGSADFDAYFRLFAGPESSPSSKEQGSRELRRLVEGLAVNETSFFRNKDHFNAILHEVLPRLYRRKREKRHLRLWSAGCSTGPEPYSLGMMLVEFLEEHGERLISNTGDLRGWRVEIVASDISEKVLHQAQSGRFRREDLRGLDPVRLERFFRPISSSSVVTAPLDPTHVVSLGQTSLVRPNSRMAYEVAQEVRSMMHFGYFNMAESAYPPEKVNSFDLVLCENVMIYFSPEVTRRVIENIYTSLTDGGFLFIGFSETLWQVSERFKLINSHDTFYYQKPFPDDPPPLRHSRSLPSTGPLNNKDKPPTTGTLRDLIAAQTDVLGVKPKEPPNTLPVSSPLGKPEKISLPQVIVSEVKKESFPDRPKSSPLPNSPTSPPPKLVTGLLPTPKINWQTALAEGLRFMEADEFDKAKRALDAALLTGKHEVDVLCAVAQLKIKLGDYEAAAELSRQAIKLNPLCETAHLLLAMMYHRENRVEEAIKEFQQTIYINFDSVIAHMRLGDIWDKQAQYSSALREYRSAIHALEKCRPGDYVEGFSVEILKQTCLVNIRRLQGPSRLR